MPKRDKAHTLSGRLVRIKAGPRADQWGELIDWYPRVMGAGLKTADIMEQQSRDGFPFEINNMIVLDCRGNGLVVVHSDQLDLELSRTKTVED